MEKPWFLKGNYLQMVGFPYLCQIIEEYVIGNSVNQFAECWNWNEVKHKLTKITERNENIWLFILKNMVPLNPLGNHHAHYQKNPQYNLVGIPHVSTKPYLTSSIIVKFLWTVAFSAPELTFFPWHAAQDLLDEDPRLCHRAVPTDLAQKRPVAWRSGGIARDISMPLWSIVY